MKSALMASASIHVGAGKDWFGYRSKERAAVIYFAHERADLVKRRLLAMCDKMGIDFPPIAIVKDHFALGKPGDHRKVVDTIKEAEDYFSLPVGLGIFDTFAKLVAAGGGDENQAMYQGAVFSNFGAIKSETDIHLAFVGHLGKNVDLGMRGSNFGLGDVDLMVELKANGEIRTAIVTKINDGPAGVLFSFKSEICNLGTDEDGDAITVNIVSGEEVDAVQSAPHRRNVPKGLRLVYDCITDAILAKGVDHRVGGDGATVKAVEVIEARSRHAQRYVSNGIGDPDAAERGNWSKNFKKAREEGLISGARVDNHELIWTVRTL
jgi:hypothetical protein